MIVCHQTRASIVRNPSARTRLSASSSWILAISLPGSSQNWDQIVGRIDKDGCCSSLRNFLHDDVALDTSLAVRRTLCPSLEVAVRLQSNHE